MKKYIKPNWKRCNLNISATLAEFLGVPNNNVTLSKLRKELSKDYKNIVFICFDGMGINPLKINLSKDDFLRKNIKKVLLSTFPSTTTNATTSLACNLLPREHGWFGWSLHFEEINRNVDIYLHSDSQTGEKVDFIYPIENNANCYFDNAKSKYNVTLIAPSYMQSRTKNKIAIENEFELCDEIRKVCSSEGKQFIYSYFPEPDSTMHDYGVSSLEAKNKIANINKEIEKLYNDLTDTLIIITSDHGQIDVEGYVEFYKDEELNDLLECVPYLDARTPAFIVKKGKEKEFETKFKQKYGKDFKLFKTKDLFKKNYFGDRGDKEYLLGDYIAIGTYTHKLFLSHENAPRFKGHHTSLTEEMLVPLIILKKQERVEKH